MTIEKNDRPLLVALIAVVLAFLLNWSVSPAGMYTSPAPRSNAHGHLDMLSATYGFLSVGNNIIILATIALAIFAFGQMEITRRSFKRQLRAYIQVESGGAYDAGGPGLNPWMGGVLASVVNIKNTGQTPAYQVVHWSGITVVDQADEDVATAPTHLSKEYPRSTIGAQGTTTSVRNLGRQLSPLEVEEISIGKKAIYVYGRIEYRDIFKRRRITTYRVGYAGIYSPPQGVSYQFAMRGNAAT